MPGKNALAVAELAFGLLLCTDRNIPCAVQDLKSGTWDKNLASEYLAEIYLKQGNKKRAIEIYEVLSLKYPEKSGFFADQIRAIKELQEQNNKE